MPNHVQHRVKILGAEKDVQGLKELMIHPEPLEGDAFEVLFDFERILPMPASLDITSGSMGEAGYDAFFSEDAGRLNRLLSFSCYKHMSTREELQAYLKEHEPGCEELGRQYADNLEKYGCFAWHEWRVRYWGTKWNAYSCELIEHSSGLLDLRFQTAWSIPFPVFDALVERFPDLTFKIDSIDEGWNFFCSTIISPDDYATTDVTLTPDFWSYVYGSITNLPEERYAEYIRYKQTKS